MSTKSVRANEGVLLIERRFERPAVEDGDGWTGEPARPTRTDPAQLLEDIQIEPLGVLLAADMVDLCTAPLDSRLAELVDDLRHRLAHELGVVLPPVRFTVERGLLPGTYRVLVDGETIAESIAPPGRVMVIGPDAGDPDDVHTVEPVFGLPVRWVRDDRAPTGADVSIASREQAMTAHLSEIARAHAGTLLSRDDVVDLIDAVRRRHPASTEEIDAGLLPLAVLHAVLRDLLESGTSIRNLRRILDELAPALMRGASYDSLVEIASRAVRPA
ncbi:MAG: FHIPEP family type III secretion protein [Actinomycetota bacterium]